MQPLGKAIFTPNTRTQIAWDVRDELLRVLGPVPQKGERETLRKVLNGVEDGIVNRDVANRVLFDLAASLSPTLAIAPHLAAERILKLSETRLSAALAELRTQEVSVRETPPHQDPAVLFGKAFVAEILGATLPANAPLPAWLGVKNILPFAWGLLAESLGVSTPQELVQTLNQATQAEQKSALDFLRAQASEALSMSRAIEEVAGSHTRDVDACIKEVRELTHNPSENAVLLDQQNRMTGVIARITSRDQEAALLELRARQRQAGHYVIATINTLAARVGHERATQCLAGFDCAQEIASVADLCVGRSVYTALDAREPFETHASQLLERLAERAVWLLGDQLLEELATSEEGQTLAKALQGEQPRAREIRAAVVRYACGLSVEAGESFADFSLRVAAIPASAIASRIVDEYRSDPNGFMTDLQGLQAQKSRLANALSAGRAVEEALRTQRDEGVLSLAPNLVRLIRQHAQADYPNESIGYLVEAMGDLFYLPVRNGLAGSDLAQLMGLEVADDAIRMEELVELFNMRPIAKVHSHPEASPVFSHEDLAGMRDSVALHPGLRTLIVGIRKQPNEGFAIRMASFASDLDGQVLREDNIHVG